VCVQTPPSELSCFTSLIPLICDPSRPLRSYRGFLCVCPAPTAALLCPPTGGVFFCATKPLLLPTIFACVSHYEFPLFCLSFSLFYLFFYRAASIFTQLAGLWVNRPCCHFLHRLPRCALPSFLCLRARGRSVVCLTLRHFFRQLFLVAFCLERTIVFLPLPQVTSLSFLLISPFFFLAVYLADSFFRFRLFSGLNFCSDGINFDFRSYLAHLRNQFCPAFSPFLRHLTEHRRARRTSLYMI